jgi:hypothetical protein
MKPRRRNLTLCFRGGGGRGKTGASRRGRGSVAARGHDRRRRYRRDLGASWVEAELDTYLHAARIVEAKKSPRFRSARGRSGALTEAT